MSPPHRKAQALTANLKCLALRALESLPADRRAGIPQGLLDLQGAWLFRGTALLPIASLWLLVAVDLKFAGFLHIDAGQMNLYLNDAREHLMGPHESEPAGRWYRRYRRCRCGLPFAQARPSARRRLARRQCTGCRPGNNA